MTTTITLYFAPYTRATRPRWLLEELGVPYALEAVDLKAGAHKTPEYLAAVHPHGSVPAAVIDGEVLIESGAIVAALADRFLDQGLAPSPTSPLRARYLMWQFYGAVTLEAAFLDAMSARKPDSPLPDDKRAAAEARWQTALAFVEGGLGDKPWILGDTFSAADCVLGSLLVWAHSVKFLEGHAAAQGYAERCRARPAFQRSQKLPS